MTMQDALELVAAERAKRAMREQPRTWRATEGPDSHPDTLSMSAGGWTPMGSGAYVRQCPASE
jgi:hypothetical protein